ncbi:hypothetical protein O6H91_04G145400 [Diphasiastrum complanatum]|uniref:Uncharacterized protein n=2 Tax=Diphasiastrum complanatum TaxID=34168 RepID=A0ACC2E2N6_DIPCM|nr:hypothetical protein O6H91_04G145400 [Diphasiastrum complanatum]KAJ7560776.1 hypothetical protein O6H91_04G145400 [Diphasiastrum complanatum]
MSLSRNDSWMSSTSTAPQSQSPSVNNGCMLFQGQHISCPECKHTDCKFRYYKNNKMSQPRYLCRRCNRQFTLGGMLRKRKEHNLFETEQERKTQQGTDSWMGSTSTAPQSQAPSISKKIPWLDSIGLEVSNPRDSNSDQGVSKKGKGNGCMPFQGQQISCPKCQHTDCKFRYHNNKKKSQPRYLCCRCNCQFTLGGMLRKRRELPSNFDHQRITLSDCADPFCFSLPAPMLPLDQWDNEYTSICGLLEMEQGRKNQEQGTSEYEYSADNAILRMILDSENPSLW